MFSETRGARDELWRLASGQRGFFSAAQALAAGYSYQGQHFHKQRGNWIRIDRGLYRFREFQDLPARPDDGLARWSLWADGQAVVSHSTALAVHGLVDADLTVVHLTVPPGFRRRHEAVVLHRATPAPDEVTEWDGFRITVPARAIAECAAAGATRDLVQGAVHTLLHRDADQTEQLLRAGERAGPRAELGIERALHTITMETER